MVPIAVVGLSGRFPGASSAAELWRNLSEGVCTITSVPADRDRYWDLRGLARTSPAPRPVGGFLSDIEDFDADFFAISQAEAAVMDPQQRIFLQEAWRAFEDAGYSAEALSGARCAVFVGSMMNEYHDLLTHTLALTPRAHEVTGVACYIPGRLAYHLNLRGPAIAIDTASSSSLVAIHLASRALQSGEADLAVAGGVSLFLTEKRIRVLGSAGILTSEGECRPFDDSAQGTLAAESVAAVVLKRLEDAVADGDAIYGVIRASGISQSGRTPGITVPSVESQSELMRQVYREAGIEAESLQYVEAHGTGTQKGDPIEAAAMSAAIGDDGRRQSRCYLGSIKANFGHAFAAAGVGSLIKVLLALQHRTIPPQIHFSKLNGAINEAKWPFTISTEPVSWEGNKDAPRRAAVSSVGLTGTNGHCVIEEAPAFAPRAASVPASGVWIVLSARTESALRQRAADLQAWVRADGKDCALVDLAFTLGAGRTAFKERLAFVARTRAEVEAGLESFLTGAADSAPELFRGASTDSDPGPEFDFAAAGEKWIAGARVDWSRWLEGTERRRLHLPTYPFEGTPTWYDRQGGLPVSSPALPAGTTPEPAPARPAAAEAKMPGVVRLKALARAFNSPPAGPTHLRAATVLTLPSPAPRPTPPDTGGERAQSLDTATTLRRLVAEALFVSEKTVTNDAKFVDLGLDSILAVELAKAIRATFGVPISAARLYDYATTAALASHLDELRGRTIRVEEVATTGFQAAAPSKSVVAPAAPVPAAHAAAATANGAQVRERLRVLVAKTLFLPLERVGENAKFTDLGLDSILAVELSKAIKLDCGLSVPTARLYDFPTIAELAGYIAQEASSRPLDATAPAGVNGGFPAPRSSEPRAAPVLSDLPWTPVAAPLDEVVALTAATLYVDRSTVSPDVEFSRLGLDSILAVELAKKLAVAFGVKIAASTLYDHVSPRKLAAHIAQLKAGAENGKAGAEIAKGNSPRPTSGFQAAMPASLRASSTPAPVSSAGPRVAATEAVAPVRGDAPRSAADLSAPAKFTPIAIIGYSGRFAGARNPEELWQNLIGAKIAVGPVPEARRALGDVPDEALAAGDVVPGSGWGAFLEGVDEFDAGFFNLAPAEAERMDPQHRVFLQEAWRALEHSGYSATAAASRRCGVFIGVSPSDYGYHVPEPDPHSYAGNAPSALPARVAYLLNWHGPAMAIDTACASTFSALDLACASLQRGETDLMMVGAVHVTAGRAQRDLIGRMGLLSPRGRCQSFDAAADGWVLGEAAGALIVKRLEDAERDGDEIHAVIRGCAVNQDGSKNGLLAPHSAGQSRLQTRLYADTGISPDSIEYVEMHGTGTPLADEVELLALGDSFRPGTTQTGYCALSTLKPNIGHTMAAAGMTGLIKVLLSFRHGAIAPIAGLETPNPALGLEGGPFFLNTQTRAWPARSGRPRRAAVNGQSALGANCHVILEEWIPRAPAPASGKDARSLSPPGVVFVLSAQNLAQLKQAAAELAQALEPLADADLARVAFTLQTGRMPMVERLAFAVATVADARRALLDFTLGRSRGGWHHRRCDAAEAGLALLLEGAAGAQFVAAMVAGGECDKLARMWVHGAVIDWTLLYGTNRPRRMALPTYPFARDRYWLQERRGLSSRPPATATASGPASGGGVESGAKVEPVGAAGVLLPLIVRLLGAPVEGVTLDTDLARAGFNSLYVLRATDRFAAATGKRIPHRWFYECPTLGDLGARIDRELGVSAGGLSAASQPAISARSVNQGREAAQGRPLSEGQKALWRIQSVHPENRAYHIPVALRWEGRVDVAAVARALEVLTQEQAALRSSFRVDGSQVEQVCDQARPVQLRQERGASGEPEVRDQLRQLSHEPFNLRTGPLWRATVVSCPTGDVLHFTFHHLIFDGHSLALFFERFEVLYLSAADGRPLVTAPSRSLASWVAAENNYLRSEHAGQDRAFWVARFPQGFAPLLAPPAGAHDEGVGALIARWIPVEVGAGLQAFAAAQRITVQGVLLAAYLALLAYEFGEGKAVTGVAVDLRATEDELETMGYGVNLLPVAAEISPEESFDAVCTRVFSHLLDALDHRRFPFRQLALALAGETGEALRADLETGFYFHSWTAASRLALPRRMIPEVHQTGEFALAFEVIELEGEWRLNVKYRPPAVTAARAEKLVTRFLAMLRLLPAGADARLADLLAPTADAPVARSDEAAGFVYPQCCVHELFQAQVGRTPRAVAAKFREAQVNYAELDARANRVAHQLVARGVQPGDLVAVALRRSLDLLAGLLAVWKAGAAYVPMDPAYPDERIAAMVDDSGTRFCLTHRAVSRRPAGVTIIDLDTDRDEIEQRLPTPPRVASTPDGLAYVIYTSGSTGRPKGVQVSQRNLVHFLSCMAKTPGCTARDRVLALTTVCFDIAALELYLPLITGASVEIAPEELTRHGAQLRAKLEEGSITLAQATPATWRMLLAAELGPVPQLRALCGGEAWDQELAGQLLQRVGELWNMYGPTETTVWSSIARVRPGAPIRLGQPIGNTQFFVLDDNFRPVRPGEVGELFIGGDGVAVGYHNNAALSEERFVTIPHLADRRVYRTGDLVRHV